MKHEIKLNRQLFWTFNGGEADRFGFFKEEERRKIREIERQFDSGTAYNYHRLNKELDSSDWNRFYRALSDKLFRQFDYLVVRADGRIFGIKNHSRHLLLTDPSAYTAALTVSEN